MADLRLFQRETFDFDEFVVASLDYLKEHSQMPVLQSQSAAKFEHNRIITWTYFFDELLDKIVRNKSKYKRDIADILAYGFIGNSRGGKNGIVLISQRDRNLGNVLERARNGEYSRFAEQIGIDLRYALPVKVVTHRKNGERLIGIINKGQGKVVLYDTKSYTK